MKTRENEGRDSKYIIILILLLGFFCIILASGWAIRFAPSWKLNTNMGSNLNPNSVFTSQPISFIGPLDPAILTQPVWLDTFLTPGISLSTRTPLPTVTATLVSLKTNTPIPTLVTETKVASPTNTLVYVPPIPATATPKPPPTNTPITPLISADLQITKTDGVTIYNPGGTLTYTVMVRNNGANAVTGAVVIDIKPTQITTWSWACTSQTGGATGCSAAASNNANFTDTVNLPNGASIVYTVTANISLAATGSLVNTASIGASPLVYTDPNFGNNSATDTDIIQIDLSITKTDGLLTYTAGNAITYTIVVSNAGPSNATGASVADTIPAAITVTTINCATTGTASCGTNNSTGNNLSYTGVSISAGAANFLTITVSGTVNPATTGNLTNTATVTAGVGQTDTTLSNNTATDTDTQFVFSADLSITKDDGVTTYTPGSNVIYTITVSNNGPNGVTNAIVTDSFLAPVTSTNWTCTPAVGAACTASGSGNINDTAVNIPAGLTVTYTVTANTASSATGSLSNTAVVSAPAGYTDTNLANNSATDTDTPASSSDLAIFSLTDGATDYVANSTKTYTLVVSNAGPSDATGATVTDVLTPATQHVSGITWTCTPAVGATCAVSGLGNINDTVNIPAGSTVTYTVIVTVAATPSQPLVNTATVSLATDPINGNNSSSDTDQLVVASTFPYPDANGIGATKDGSYFVVPSGTYVTLQFGTALVVGSHVGYDLVYYEWAQGANPGIWMDSVILQVGDGSNWYTILNWGDGSPDTNTNIPVPLLVIPPNTNCAGEPDNCVIDASLLYNLTGVAIDLNSVVLPGTYPYIRIYSPYSAPAGPDVDGGVEVDAFEVLP